MGETTDQIENHIENKREDLQSNLRELEHKVKSATDWRQQFQNHTGTMVAAAFGGGMLVSTMVGRKNSRSGSQPGAMPAPASSAPRLRGGDKHEVLETWDTIKAALVGVAAAKFKGVLGEVVPGFSDHLAQFEAKRGRASTNGRSAESIIEG
jgi:hypothetical protein